MMRHSSDYFYAFGSKLPKKYWKRIHFTLFFAIFLLVVMAFILGKLGVRIENKIFFLIYIIPVVFFYFLISKRENKEDKMKWKGK